MDIARIAQQQVVLQLMDNVLLNSKGIHYHVVPAMEFNKVKASEGGRVLILVASGDSQIQAFHAVGQIRHPVAVHLDSLPLGHGGQKSHHHGGGGSKTGSWRRIAL